MLSFADIVVIGLPLLVVGFAVWTDLRTRRGYGLGLLALVLAGLIVWVIVTSVPTLDLLETNSAFSSREGFSAGFVFAIYFGIAGYLALILWIGALIEASVARQWWWLAGLVTAALLQVSMLLIDFLLFRATHLLGLIRGIRLALDLLPATVAVLTYSILRIMRPALRPPSQLQERTA